MTTHTLTPRLRTELIARTVLQGLTPAEAAAAVDAVTAGQEPAPEVRAAFAGLWEAMRPTMDAIRWVWESLPEDVQADLLAQAEQNRDA